MLLLGHLVLSLQAQNCITIPEATKKQLSRLDDARAASGARDYAKALKMLDRLLADHTGFVDAWMLQSEVLYRAGQLSEAAAALERAVRCDSMYEARNLYALGRLYAEMQQYGRALPLLERYLQVADLTEPDLSRVSRQLTLVHVRHELMANPVAFEPYALGPAINTPADESLPVFTVDGTRMVFTRREGRQEDLYMARWNEATEVWQEARPLSAINSEFNEGAQAISADGRTIAFTSCGRPGGAGSCDIYLAHQLPDGTWSPATVIAEVNTRGWEGQPALTADGRGMFFSSERPGGFGKRDLWYSAQDASGSWSTPVNLGPEINTPGNESSPFLHLNGHTLYFMSDGHPGMGDYDLFVTHRRGEEWNPPRNLGFPVNTEQHEGALTVHPNGTDAYYTAPATSAAGRRPHLDIYRFTLEPALRAQPVSYVYGRVKDVRSHEPLVATIEIYELERPERIFHYQSSENGTFMAALPHGVEYGLHVRADGYVFYSDQFALDADAPYDAELLEALLVPVVATELATREETVVLRNIQFETNSARLRVSSFAELNRLLTLLRDYPGMAITIAGHTDNVGETDFNQRLSEERARAVYDWLVDQGIAAERLDYVGYGETRPLADNASEAGRALNRRTEFVIHRN